MNRPKDIKLDDKERTKCEVWTQLELWAISDLFQVLISERKVSIIQENTLQSQKIKKTQTVLTKANKYDMLM